MSDLHCNVCNKGFSTTSNLLRHKRTQHATDNPLTNEIHLAWSALPIWHPQKQLGLSIISKILGFPVQNPITTNIQDSFEIEPTHEHLAIDVEQTIFPGEGAIISTVTCQSAPHLTRAHLNASFRAVDSKNLGAMSPTRLCAASSIQISASGLGSCNPRVPEVCQNLGILPYDRLDGSFIYTPAGHITDLHQDSLYQGRIVVALLGRKLLLSWPPTNHNLQVYQQYHGHFTGIVLPAVIDVLEEPTMTLLKHGGVTYLPPGTLHSVLTLDSSATFAYDILLSTMLDDIPRLVQWEIKVAKTLIAHGDPTDTVPSIVDDHDFGTALWLDHLDTFFMAHTSDAIEALRSAWEQARPALTA
ncbi:hypothetical protein OC842_007249 [Tilletia horrida]|uniref:C2H2-type domain-containing protein n=1 Tax=Tilletia horrida TaxID=155126 RepID=A0AAN6JHB2_9BASI|nr:hypothetical protein OC842_007249 [Tilletia horrida]